MDAIHFDRTHRKTAIAVGILFVIATAFLFLGEAFYAPLLDAPDYLERIYPDCKIYTFGVLIEYVCVLAIPLIAVVFYPVLKQFSEPLAIGYVVFRALEAAILIAVAETAKLSLVGVSRDYLSRGDLDASMFQSIGGSILAANEWAGTSGPLYLVVFITGALMLYWVLYQSRLAPRWLAVWGLAGALSLLAATLLYTFELIPPEIGLALMLPIAVQEMLMAAWFIFKGFDPTAFEPARG